MNEHRSAIFKKKTESVAKHFNLDGHTIKEHFRVSVIQSFPDNSDGAKEEDDIINRLEAIEHGINKNQALKK